MQAKAPAMICGARPQKNGRDLLDLAGYLIEASEIIEKPAKVRSCCDGLSSLIGPKYPSPTKLIVFALLKSKLKGWLHIVCYVLYL